ncbi:hypothetical protein OG216_35040 [Streptomycetaceae bacterium NBC_01309]
MSAEYDAPVFDIEPPSAGEILETIYGRQRVIDIVCGVPHRGPTVHFRPERGGSEWQVDIAQLSEVLLGAWHRDGSP